MLGAIYEEIRIEERRKRKTNHELEELYKHPSNSICKSTTSEMAGTYGETK